MQGHGKPRMPAAKMPTVLTPKAGRTLWRLGGLWCVPVEWLVPGALPGLLCLPPARKSAVHFDVWLSRSLEVLAAKGARYDRDFLASPQIIPWPFGSMHHKAPLSHLGGMVIKVLSAFELPPLPRVPSRPARRPAEFQRTSGQFMGRCVLPTVETRHTRTWPGYRLGLSCLQAASSPSPRTPGIPKESRPFGARLCASRRPSSPG